MGGPAGHGSTAAPPKHYPAQNEYHEAPGPAGHSRWPSLPAAAGGGWAARRSLVVVLVMSCWVFLRFSFLGACVFALLWVSPRPSNAGRNEEGRTRVSHLLVGGLYFMKPELHSLLNA